MDITGLLFYLFETGGIQGNTLYYIRSNESNAWAFSLKSLFRLLVEGLDDERKTEREKEKKEREKQPLFFFLLLLLLRLSFTLVLSKKILRRRRNGEKKARFISDET